MEPAHFTNNIYYTEITVQTSTSSHQPWRQKTEITKGIYYWQHLSIFYLVLLIHNLDTILHLHTTNNLIHFFLLLLSELNPLIIIKLLQRTELLQVLNTYFTCKFQQTSSPPTNSVGIFTRKKQTVFIYLLETSIGKNHSALRHVFRQTNLSEMLLSSLKQFIIWVVFLARREETD